MTPTISVVGAPRLRNAVTRIMPALAPLRRADAASAAAKSAYARQAPSECLLKARI
jgi:hypothetical protein